jgi:hypothetical protein
MTEEKKFRFLIPLTAPPSLRNRQPNLYDDILEEFTKSDLKYAELKDLGRNLSSANYCLRKKIKKQGKKVSVIYHRKEGKIILIKTSEE